MCDAGDGLGTGAGPCVDAAAVGRYRFGEVSPFASCAGARTAGAVTCSLVDSAQRGATAAIPAGNGRLRTQLLAGEDFAHADPMEGPDLLGGAEGI